VIDWIDKYSSYALLWLTVIVLLQVGRATNLTKFIKSDAIMIMTVMTACDCVSY